MPDVPASQTATGPGQPPDGAGSAIPRRGRWEGPRSTAVHLRGHVGRQPLSRARLAVCALFWTLVVIVWGSIRERDVHGI